MENIGHKEGRTDNWEGQGRFSFFISQIRKTNIIIKLGRYKIPRKGKDSGALEG